MDFGIEDEHVEFKRSVGSGAIKTIVAFSNTGGGTLYIGVDDDGTALGIDDVDAEMTRLVSMMRDSIRPDVLAGVSCDARQADNGRKIIVVRVERGIKRPYYLASKGPRPEGVYVRSGSASVPATETSILRMIQETEGDTFEARPSLRQDLSFSYARHEFSRKGLPLGEGEQRTLGIVLAGGTYTNLGLLLSDQCPPTVKSALFADDDRNVFAAREEYEGSVLKQLAEAYAFLERNNRYRTEYQGLERSDYYDVPPVALREALVNSVAHREYALSGPTLVSVMPDGVEIVSPGGLPLGLEEQDLSAHVSVPRNKALANVLFRLEIIEAYGTGLGRIRASYAGSGVEPRIRLTPNTFTVFLPNRNAPGARSAANAGVAASANSGTEELLGFLASGPKSRREVQEALGVSQSSAIRLLSDLVGRGLVERRGAGRSTRYALSGRGAGLLRG